MRGKYIPAVMAMLAVAATAWAGEPPYGRSAGTLMAQVRPYEPPGRPQYEQPPHQFYRGEGPHNGDWLRNTMRLPPAEQQRMLQQDPRFHQLPPQRQEELLNRLQHFNALPPQQQQRVLNRMEMIEHLPPAQQQETRALFGQFRSLPQERKIMIRRTLLQMRTMPPQDRERFLDSPLTSSYFSPQEMNMLRSFNAIGFVGPQ
jgi:hypothetical protein